MVQLPESRGMLTELLAESAAGDSQAFDRIFELVYPELRRMAHAQLVGSRRGQTLDTTALVHEAYLKLIDSEQVTRRDRAYFFGAAARAMRQVLVDAARRRTRIKRGAGQAQATFDESSIGVEGFATDVMAMDECLTRLAVAAPRQARIVECRFFGGMTIDEVAEAMQLSRRTVLRDWTLARAWLLRELDEGGGEHGPAQAG